MSNAPTRSYIDIENRYHPVCVYNIIRARLMYTRYRARGGQGTQARRRILYAGIYRTRGKKKKCNFVAPPAVINCRRRRLVWLFWVGSGGRAGVTVN